MKIPMTYPLHLAPGDVLTVDGWNYPVTSPVVIISEIALLKWIGCTEFEIKMREASKEIEVGCSPARP